ncbi:MAG: hypothetical protein HY321_22775 [Armatimonadetes bacterium]|nr:hypothetical protein [Armatimonadota bacterium]
MNQVQERVACPDCRGRGRRTFGCLSCDGTGEEHCCSCGGHGRRAAPWETDPAYCPDCRGLGHQRCEACGGRGYAWEDCRTCDGEGYMSQEEAEIILGERLLARRQQEERHASLQRVWVLQVPPVPPQPARGVGWLRALIHRFLGAADDEPAFGQHHVLEG